MADRDRDRGESLRERGSTPRMRRQLRVIAVLAGFVGLIVVIAFAGAVFRSEDEPLRTTWVKVAGIPDVEHPYLPMHVPGNVVVEGETYAGLDLFVVRTGRGPRVLWARSPHLGCRVVPKAELEGGLRGSAPADAAFGDRCGGSMFALDGQCVAGPCPRGLDGFEVAYREGEVYVDVSRLVHGRPRSPT
jgi:Rieske Fe-S protein